MNASAPGSDGSFDTVLVVDFGAQYAQLIARRVREAHVYSEIVPPTISPDEIAARKPRGVIFSGGPASVHVEGSPTIDPGVYELGIPVLGICYGAQLIAQQRGGTVGRTDRGEYGLSLIHISEPTRPVCTATSSGWAASGPVPTRPKRSPVAPTR